MSKRPIILFDSKCPICDKIKGLISIVDIKNDIHFCSIHEKEIYNEIPEINYRDCRKTVHLVDQNGRVYTGEGVVEYLFDRYSWSKKFSKLYKSRFGNWALKKIYQELNDYRKSRSKNCQVCQY